MEDAILLDDNMFLWDMESLDRLDGIPADLMRRDDDSDDPQQQQQSGSVSNLSAWHRLPTPPPPPTMPNGRTTDMESVWERDLSSKLPSFCLGGQGCVAIVLFVGFPRERHFSGKNFEG